jgi:hypothetical protein
MILSNRKCKLLPQGISKYPPWGTESTEIKLPCLHFLSIFLPASCATASTVIMNCNIITSLGRNQDSSFSVATIVWTTQPRNKGSNPTGPEFFPSPQHPHLSVTHEASYPIGTRDVPQEIKQQQGVSSSAKIKNAWSYTSMPACIFMAWLLMNHRRKL